MDQQPLVSVIIPCRNEHGFIENCLASIVKQDYPKDKLEVLVLDGMSDDGTRELVQAHANCHPFIKLLDNPRRITPCALNLGIKSSTGQIIMVAGAHATYEKDYISKCASHLSSETVDGVGGLCKVRPQEDRLVANSIACVLSSSFGAGNAYYRIGSKKKRYVDTLFGACYKKEVFDTVGLFDEDMVRTQDSEFNARLTANGGRILLVPELTLYYYARDSLLKLWKTNFQYGYFKALASKKIGRILALRQLVPPLFVGSLIISLMLSLLYKPFLWLFVVVLGSYITTNLLFSLKFAIKKSAPYFFVLPLVFATIHVSWGLGFLKGIWDFVILRRYKRRKIIDTPPAR